ncbi:MAG: hypothetical protein KA207_15225 [Burkholderiaceae bacterium]|nr:hypothetical protein [Burkholderiaceae bacterium]
MTFSILVGSTLAVAILTACSPSQEEQTRLKNIQAQATVSNQELAVMTKERDSLKARVEELSITPQYLLAKVQASVNAGKIEDSEKDLAALVNKFPEMKETREGQRIVDALRKKLEKQQAEVRRFDELGFKAVPVRPKFAAGAVNANVGTPSISKKFVFDKYNDSYHYIDADRDSKFVVSNVTFTAPKGTTDPELPGFGLYWASGKELRRIGVFNIKFQRWEDYATYLGNYHDSKNDFAKTSTVAFVLGMQASDESLANRPLYLVATTSGCTKRNFERFKTPPVFYDGACTDLTDILRLDSVSSEWSMLKVVQRID